VSPERREPVRELFRRNALASELPTLFTTGAYATPGLNNWMFPPLLFRMVGMCGTCGASAAIVWPRPAVQGSRCESGTVPPL
jgi:hypothetical protein